MTDDVGDKILSGFKDSVNLKSAFFDLRFGLERMIIIELKFILYYYSKNPKINTCLNTLSSTIGRNANIYRLNLNFRCLRFINIKTHLNLFILENPNTLTKILAVNFLKS